MSENENKENKSGGSKGGNHHRRHHRGNNKNKNNRPAEQKQNEAVKANAPAAQKNQNQNQSQKNNNQKNNNQKSNDQRHNQHRSNKNDNQKKRREEPSFLDTAPDNDSIFGSISVAQPVKKERPVSVEPIEIRELSDEELFGTSHIFYTPKEIDGETVEIVGIRFKSHGKMYYFDPNGIKFSKGEFAILETARGVEFGEVCLANTHISEKDIVPPLQKVIRRAVKDDIDRNALNKKKEKEAFKICLEKIANHGLDMKLVDVQCSFDNSKYLFYFTSAGRVDFRELVRDLASQFKTRIELRQIGIRDEAKLIGGIGICGRPICCSRHLSNFAQVSIKMAKEQGLSLSSNKISGNCGRLMCCLNFENQTYLDEIKRTPMPGSLVKIDGKTGNVTDANPLTGMLKVRIGEAPDGEIIATHRDKVTIISKKGAPETAEAPEIEE